MLFIFCPEDAFCFCFFGLQLLLLLCSGLRFNDDVILLFISSMFAFPSKNLYPTAVSPYLPTMWLNLTNCSKNRSKMTGLFLTRWTVSSQKSLCFSCSICEDTNLKPSCESSNLKLLSTCTSPDSYSYRQDLVMVYQVCHHQSRQPLACFLYRRNITLAGNTFFIFTQPITAAVVHHAMTHRSGIRIKCRVWMCIPRSANLVHESRRFLSMNVVPYRCRKG